MAKQFIDDGEKGFIVRKKINENFSELYYNDSLFLSGSDLSLNYLTKYGNDNTLLNSLVYSTTAVGIGTVSPVDRLHVAGGNIVGYSGATSSSTGIVVRNKTATDYTIDGRIIVDTVNSPNKVIIGSATNHPLQIVTNNTQRVWIDSSGISTSGNLNASGNLNISGDVTISGNLSALGTTTQIDTKMYVTSAVSVINTGTGPALTVKQTGSNDIATFFDDNNVAMILKDGGNVGIGTNFPSQKLHVTNGQASGDVRIALGTGVNALEFIRNGSADNSVRSYGGEFLIDQQANSSLIFRTNATEKLRITADGNVGIGTTSPSTKLEINNSSTGVSSTWQGGTDFVKLFANNGEWSEQAIAFQEAGTNVGAKIGVKNTANGAYDIIFANRSNSSLTSSLSERVRITHLGNVGIGNTNPTAPLSFANSVATRKIALYDTFNNNNQFFGFGVENNTLVYSVDFSGADHVFFSGINSTSRKELLRIKGDGNVGIGTASPVDRLSVNGPIYIEGGTSNYTGYNDAVEEANRTNTYLALGPAGSNNDWAYLRQIGGDNAMTLAIDLHDDTSGSSFAIRSIASAFTPDQTPVTRFIIDGGGNVGIGTSSPVLRARLDISDGGLNIGGTGALDATLHIKSSFGGMDRLTQISPTGASKPALNLMASTDVNSNNNWWVWGVDSNVWKIQPSPSTTFGGSNGLFINSSGNVGIGTTNPSASLQFGNVHGKKISMWDAFNDDNQFYGFGIDTGTLIYNVESSFAKHVFYSGINSTSKRELFRINGDGNVGIGISSPQGKLDVNGGFTIIRPTNDDPAGGHCILFPRAGTDPYTNPSRLEIRLYETESIIYNHWAGTGVVRNLTVGSGGAYHHYNGTTGNIGIGTYTPNEKLTIVGNLSATGTGTIKTVNSNTTSDDVLVLGANNVIEKRTLTLWNAGSSGLLGNGLTTNYITKYGTSNDLLNSQIFDNGTNVGIGTTSPLIKLHVSGSNFDGGGARFESSNHANGVTIKGMNGAGINDTAYLAFKSENSSHDSFIGLTGDAASAGDLRFSLNGEKVRIKNNGNVGIGTTSPTAKLDVEGSVAVNYLRVDAQDGVNEGGEIQLKGAGSYGDINIDNFTGNLRFHTLGTNNYFEIIGGSSSSAALRIPTGGATINGNVGIGTTSPSTKLHISSTDTFGVTIENTTVNPTNFADADNFTLFKNYYGNTQISNWQRTGMRIGSRTTANGGIGQIVFTTGNDTERMRLDASGNLGIGTSSPSTKLDVNGVIRSNNEIIGSSLGGHGQARYIAGNYGVIHRNDASDYYILKTLSNDQYGGWDSSRPFSINLATGNVGMVYTDSAKVGIGTGAPTQKLHVVDSNSSDGNGTALFASTGGNSNIKIDAINTGFFAYQNFSQGGVNRFELGICNGSSDFYINRNVQSGTAGASIYVKKSDGNVGIGTTAPDYELQVAGSLGIGRSVGIDNREIKFRGDGVAHFSIYGAESGESFLSIRNTSSTNSPGNAGTTLFAVHSNGNVGIGTTSPAARLDVAGDISVNTITIGRGGNNNDTNTVVGLNSLRVNTGTQNTAIGTNTFYSNTIGSQNTAVGNGAIYANTIGTRNTACGTSAIQDNISGSDITAVGAFALWKNTASGNTACGSEALRDNSTGLSNTAVGYNALKFNTTGGSNTAVGSNVLLYNTGQSNTGVGAGALGNNISGLNNTAVGIIALNNNSGGNGNAAFGNSALAYMTAGVNNTAVGSNALTTSTTYTNCGAFGYNAQVSGNNQIRIGDTNITSVTCQTNAWSDERDKADIRDTVLGLNFIEELRPVDFKWDYREDYRPEAPVTVNKPLELNEDASEEEKVKYEEELAAYNTYKVELDKWFEDCKWVNLVHDGTHKRTRFHHGLIAQEVKSLIERTGVDFGGFQDHTIKGGDAVMTIGYTELIAPMIKAIQELSAEVKTLKDKLKDQ